MSAAEAGVARVLVLSKTHLDVGFTDLATVVRRRYLDEFFPRAIRVAAELRERGGPERLRWITGSWILTEALEEDARQGRHDVERALESGDLGWHAMPFTTHTEYCERSLFEHGLSLSAALDDRFGRRTHAAKMTDVPGHTRGLVSVLAGAGVDFLHIGVNPASTAPDVPHLFRWRDDSAPLIEGTAPEVTVMYQPGSYGDVQVLPGGTTAVAVDLTGDNLGPRGVPDVVERWAVLQRRFPAAELVAATFDDVADALSADRSDLPVVSAEIGDTWIHGVGTDPRKTAAFRASCRARREWIDGGWVDAADPVLQRASTELLLVAEHTWGLDQKTHWPEQGHWAAAELATRRGDDDTARFESSWAEQRGYLDRFVELLEEGGRGDLAASALLARASSEAARPFVGDLELRAPSGTSGEVAGDHDPVCVEAAGFHFVVASDGSLAGLTAPDGRVLATPDSPLARLWIQTFDAADIERRFGTYNSVTAPEDMGWARQDNTKPGLERSGAVSALWGVAPRHLWVGERDGVAVLVVELAVAADRVRDPVAAPDRAFLTVCATHAAEVTAVEFDLSTFGTPAARWPAATWWSFVVPVEDPSDWAMEKLGERVSPLDLVPGGGRSLHCADRLVHDGSEVSLELVDASLVSLGRPRLTDVDDRVPDLSTGWHVCLHDNLWGTNFPMWVEGDARFRVVLRAGPGH